METVAIDVNDLEEYKEHEKQVAQASKMIDEFDTGMPHSSGEWQYFFEELKRVFK